MNQIIDRIVNCFLFSRQNRLLFLAIYDVTYLTLCTLFTDDYEYAFYVASLTSLSIMLFFTLSHLYKTLQERVAQPCNGLVKGIRNEYQHAHGQNRKKTFLLKSKLIADNENEILNFNNSFIEQKVHLSYLNRSGTHSLHPSNNKMGQH